MHTVIELHGHHVAIIGGRRIITGGLMDIRVTKGACAWGFM